MNEDGSTMEVDKLLDDRNLIINERLIPDFDETDNSVSFDHPYSNKFPSTLKNRFMVVFWPK